MAQPLPRRYTAFDVETPNRNRGRMSAIGLTVVEDGASPLPFLRTYDLCELRTRKARAPQGPGFFGKISLIIPPKG